MLRTEKGGQSVASNCAHVNATVVSSSMHGVKQAEEMTPRASEQRQPHGKSTGKSTDPIDLLSDSDDNDVGVVVSPRSEVSAGGKEERHSAGGMDVDVASKSSSKSGENVAAWHNIFVRPSVSSTSANTVCASNLILEPSYVLPWCRLQRKSRPSGPSPGNRSVINLALDDEDQSSSTQQEAPLADSLFRHRSERKEMVVPGQTISY